MKSRLQRVRYCGSAVCLIVLSLFVSACNQSADTSGAESAGAVDYNTIEWTDLIPKEDLEALLNPPDILSEIPDGSQEDQIDSNIQSKSDEPPQTAYDKALVSTNVVASYDTENIRLPGFVVPLEFDESFVVTEFFLVPYFGACLHMPPPPPNQIVYVKHSEGIKLESTQQPYWVSGVLTTEDEVNDLAHAAYSMVASDVSIYEEVYEEE